MPLADSIRMGVTRLFGLASRFREDGRLPPLVRRLYIEAWCARLRQFVGRARPGDLERFAWRGPVAGPITGSLDRLGQEQVVAACAALDRVGLDHYLVDRRQDGWTIGMAANDRRRAWAALEALERAHDWRIVLQRGSRRRQYVVGDRGMAPLRAVRSTEWLLGRIWTLGRRRLGESASVEFTFWEVGTSGLNERLGVRGGERFEVDTPVTVEHVGVTPLRGRAAFPIERGARFVHQPVDIVYTWVDSSDAEWRKSKERWSRMVATSPDPVGRHDSRFESRDELRYSMRSVWLYAGWVRHIFVVTAGQVPSWLRENAQVTVVDHAEILPADVLPTFNSHAIEAALHRIDGLSEHFVYLNDDVLIGRSVRPEDFFTPAGAPRVFLSDSRVDAGANPRAASVDSAARRGRSLLADEFGIVVSRKPAHGPFALRRGILDELEHRFPEAIADTTAHRFRHASDVSVVSSLAQHYGLLTGQAIEGDLAMEYVAVESARLRLHLDRLRLTDEFDAYCLNATGIRASVPQKNELALKSFFEDRYPIAAPWERR